MLYKLPSAQLFFLIYGGFVFVEAQAAQKTSYQLPVHVACFHCCHNVTTETELNAVIHMPSLCSSLSETIIYKTSSLE